MVKDLWFQKCLNELLYSEEKSWDNCCPGKGWNEMEAEENSMNKRGNKGRGEGNMEI